MSKLVQRFVEWRIKTHLKAGDVNGFLTWLTIAKGPFSGDKQVHYVFADGRSLQDYVHIKSSQLLSDFNKLSFVERYLPVVSFTADSQLVEGDKYPLLSYFRNFFKGRRVAGFLLPSQSLISTLLKAMTSSIEQSTLSGWQKFLSRNMPTRNVTTASTAGHDDFNDVLNQLKPVPTESKLPPASLREKYTPGELLERPELLKNRMGIKPKEKKIDHRAFTQEKRRKVPAHLSAEFDLQMVHEVKIDQIRVRTQQTERKTDINLDKAFAREQKLDHEVFMERILLEEADYAKSDTHAGITSGILLALKRKYHTQDIKLISSPSVKAMLNKNDRFGFSFSRAKNNGYITLDNLPLGYSVVPVQSEDKDSTLYFRLNFSRELREDQRKDAKHAMAFDPLRADPNPPFTDMDALEKESVDNLLRSRKIQLTQEQHGFIKQHLDTFLRRPYFINLLKTLGRNNEEAVPRLINRLMVLKKRRITPEPRFGVTVENLLDVFLKFYSEDLVGFFSPAMDAALVKLPELKDTELHLFFLLSHVNLVSSTRSFEENWNAFQYFTNFFKTRPLPTFMLYKLASEHDNKSKGLFFALGLTLECVSLSSLPDFQRDLLADLPKALNVATELLRSGYAFVHQCMLVEEDTFPSINEVLTQSWEELKNKFARSHPHLSPAACFKAVYLRYIAAHIPTEHVQEAYSKWSLVTGKNFIATEWLEDQDQSFASKWMKLQRYLREDLPTRFSAPASAPGVASLITIQSDQRGLYSFTDINELLPCLELEAKVDSKLKSQLEQINQQMPDFQNASETHLKIKLESIRKGIENGQDHTVAAIGLIRELHFRRTYNQSTKVPKVGEWLRLEQMVSILLGVNEDSSQLFQIETSEGKSLIISCIALLEALHGKKVDITTHTESMGQHAVAHVNSLAGFLGLTLAERSSSSAEEIIASSIYCADLSNAILDRTLERFHLKKDILVAGMRRADVCLLDEADNAKDRHAKTSLEVSMTTENQGDNELTEHIVDELNHIIREQLIHETQLTTDAGKRQFILEKLSRPSLPADFDLDYWIKAITAALPLEEMEDYVIENERLCIVDWEVNGHKDLQSQWGNGVHYCQTLWEKSHGADVKLPEFSTLVASGDVASFLGTYKKVVGLTGTLGSKAVREKIAQVLGISKKAIIMPRAKRPEPENAKWPRIGNKPIYKRSYNFPLLFTENKTSHREKLLEILQESTNLSTMVHFKTIKECEQFARFLMDNGLNNIQIFDAKQDDEKSGHKFRPQEATVIANASQPGKITLTTAAGGRAIDMKSVNQNLMTSPALGRILKQGKDRVGRNGEFAVVYEVYCIEDLDSRAQEDWAAALEAGMAWEKNRQLVPEGAHIESQRTLLEAMQERLEQADLDRIDTQKPLRDLKQLMQNTMVSWLKTCEPSLQKKHVENWAGFFNKVSKERDMNKAQAQWNSWRTSSAIPEIKV